MILKHQKSKGVTKVNIPFSGLFNLVNVALEAGFEKENIETSDISIFSSVIGYYITGQPLETMNVSMIEEGDKKTYDNFSEVEKVAFIIYKIKLAQFKIATFYERQMFIHMVRTFEKQIKYIASQLDDMKERWNGIVYEIKDARQILSNIDPQEIILVHPPSYRGGYSKQFKIEGIINFDYKFEEFDYKTEAVEVFSEARKLGINSIWSFYKITDVEAKYQLSAEKKKVTIDNDKVEIYAATQIERFDDYEGKTGVVSAKDNFFKKVKKVKIVPYDYQITEKTKIEAVTINKETALYLRDIWAHKMGVTAASSYYVITLDEMAFGVTGLELRTVYTLKDTVLSEVFGFDQPLVKHPKSHRLFMMLLTSQEMVKVLKGNSAKNRIWEIKSFKTICMTKYRKLKSSNGILEVTLREKLPNGNYRLVYETPTSKRNFQQTLEYWLNEDGGAYVP